MDRGGRRGFGSGRWWMRSLWVYLVSMSFMGLQGCAAPILGHPVNSRLATLYTLVGCCRLANMAGIWRAGKLDAIS